MRWHQRRIPRKGKKNLRLFRLARGREKRIFPYRHHKQKYVCEQSMVYTDKYENSVAGEYNVQRHDQKERQEADQRSYVPY